MALVVAAAKLALAAAAPCLAPRVAGAVLIRRAPHLVGITPWAMLLAAHGAGRGCGGGQQQEDRIGDRMHTRQTRMR